MQISYQMEEVKHRKIQPLGKVEVLNLLPSQNSSLVKKSSSSWEQLYGLQGSVRNKSDGLLVNNAG